MNPENIPSELKDLPRWLLWRLEQRNGNLTKTPYQISGYPAATDNPAHWTSFENALAALRAGNGGYSGVGFVFNGDGLIGIDLDDCIQDGKLSPAAQILIDRLGTYAEISPSGRGAKAFCRAALALDRTGFKVQNPDAGIGALEVYRDRRFFTVTGTAISAPRLGDSTAVVTDLVQRYYTPRQTAAKTAALDEDRGQGDLTKEDERLLSAIATSEQGEKFSRLYAQGQAAEYGDDHSRADLALCSILGWWTQDPKQIDRIFQHSALCRNKWGRDDYAERTISLALTADHSRTPAEAPTAAECGFQPVEVANPVAVVKPVAAPRPWTTFAEMVLMPPPPWVVGGLMPAESLIMFYGDSNSAKTFLAQDISLCVATGKPFLDTFPVCPGSVIYVAAEGRYDIVPRFAAWQQHYQLPEAHKNVVVFPKSIRITDNWTGAEFFAGVLDAIRANDLPQIRLVVLDTMHRVWDGDENAGADVGYFVRALDLIKDTLRTSVIVIHHVGKDHAKGARGSIALRQDFEHSFKFTGTPNTEIEMRADKVKSIGYPDAIRLEGRVVNLTQPEITSRWPKEYHSSLVLLPKTSINAQIASTTSHSRKEISAAWLLYDLAATVGPATLATVMEAAVKHGKTVNKDTYRKGYEFALLNGFVSRAGNGTRTDPHTYTLTDKGQTLVSAVVERFKAEKTRQDLTQKGHSADGGSG